jgi:hypothetical protein
VDKIANDNEIAKLRQELAEMSRQFPDLIRQTVADYRRSEAVMAKQPVEEPDYWLLQVWDALLPVFLGFILMLAWLLFVVF